MVLVVYKVLHKTYKQKQVFTFLYHNEDRDTDR